MRRASIVFPEPGGPTIRRLCDPVAAISIAPFACSWPRTRHQLLAFLAGVALAKGHDLEIVTSDSPMREALLGSTADEVYDILVRQRVFGMPRSDGQKANDLLGFVIVSEFDLESLSLADIAELNQQRTDLSALKAALLAEVADLGAVPGREAWNDLLAVRASDVMEEWGSRSSLRSLFSQADPKELAGGLHRGLKDVAPALAAGGAATALAGALPGLAVGAVFGTAYLALKWRESARPYRFLSHLAQRSGRSRHVLWGSPA
jgi:hypothetical protein